MNKENDLYIFFNLHKTIVYKHHTLIHYADIFCFIWLSALTLWSVGVVMRWPGNQQINYSHSAAKQVLKSMFWLLFSNSLPSSSSAAIRCQTCVNPAVFLKGVIMDHCHHTELGDSSHPLTETHSSVCWGRRAWRCMSMNSSFSGANLSKHHVAAKRSFQLVVASAETLSTCGHFVLCLCLWFKT